ncbi:PQQ-dependent sugar dehydrogenase [Mucilaginibacter sp. Bleaf8]|uniref:PQQ-dependent sugar dehydrogenase n=1 Tax=Mucilaginibacter sp. Bleaf8 TaxID=2834430 RepID=UPI001BCC70D3|nr:PQQ-dependent sugar dehydrogenase [Mucilaginibacter sp. Bleaf8]MBS7564853.1 PQQ-dependent sugar dehydrogenase [Mucilaginibacter sp. Bleaf8]
MQTITYKPFLIGLSLVAVLTACRNKSAPSEDQPGKGTTTDSASLPPVETNAPNSNYKPAFAGQTRIGGVRTKTPLSITVLNSNLQRPWAICNLPDGRFLVTQKGGKMVILTPNGQVSKEISNLPAVVDEGQGGLLDVNIDPQFASNRMVYWDYAEKATGGSLLAVAKGKLSDDETRIENPQVIYRATPAYNGSLQFGSRILFDDEGNLFVSTGERGANDIRVKAQDLSAAIGKVVHITKDGKPVPNGPFANTPNARPEIFAYGLRNPEGMTWNPETHELWEVEFGPRGGDEVNIIRAGKNYGWPVITYGIEYSGEKVGEGIQQKSGMEQPIYYWDPVISPAGTTFYNSDVIPEWKGNLFIGALSGNHVIRLVIKDNKVTGEERLLADKGERFRAITQGKDGALYTVTDGGKLYRIGKK